MRLIKTRLNYGENINWVKPSEVTSFIIWRLETPKLTSRFINIANYDGVTDFTTHGSHALSSFVVESTGFKLLWLDIDQISRDGGRESLMVSGYNSDGQSIIEERFIFPTGAGNELQNTINEERDFLNTLLNIRKDASVGSPIFEALVPEGGGEHYRDMAVLDARIKEVRSRIAMFENSLRGQSTLAIGERLR